MNTDMGSPDERGIMSVGADELVARIASLRGARPALLDRTPEERVSVLAEVVESWLAVGSSWMRRAVDELAAVGRFSKPMLEHGLPTMIAPLRGDAIHELVGRELGAWPVASGPGLALHVLPSNLPGHAAIPAGLSLALGIACLLKSGRDDRVFARLWAESIRQVDPEVGACLDSVYWPGGSRALEDTVLTDADLVVAAGGDAAIADIERRCRGRFIGHGHRVSWALVVADAERAAAVSSLAADVAMWDQLGCLSPHVCFVEGDLESARTFAQDLAKELAELAVALPATPLSAGEAVAVRRFRESAAWRRFGGGTGGVLEVSGAIEAGSVVVADELAFEPTPQHRNVRIVPFARTDEVMAVLRPLRGRVEAVGVAASAQFAALADELEGSGVPHVVELGRMQTPTLAWGPSGRPRVADWFSVQ